jgi:hypothetical protein
MSGVYVYPNGMAVQAPPTVGYGMYSNDIRQWDPRIIVQDPDADVRLQLQSQSGLIDR